MNITTYNISNESNITEILSHFDSNYVIETIVDKLDNLDFSSSLIQPNVVAAFEENFKLMKENFPGDESNINIVRTRIYKEIIDILCNRFNLQFNEYDDTIDLYTAAFYLYEFLICNRNTIMVSFFSSFIINNKDMLYTFIMSDDKKRDGSNNYNKKMFTDYKYVVISTNIEKIINYIATLDIKLINIFQSVYVNPEVVMFLDNAFADKGNFFYDFYCKNILKESVLPIIITNIRLDLQKIVGNIGVDNIQNILNKGDL